MPFFDRLKKIFNNPQADAEKRVSRLLVSGADWPALEKAIYPDKGVGPRISAVLGMIIDTKRWDILTPIIEKSGDYLDTLSLVYRSGEYGTPPASRAQELEDIYQAISASPRHSAKVLHNFMTMVENWACQHNSEACYDWAAGKKEFVPVPPLGLAALGDQPVDGNPLAMKVLATVADVDRAIDAADWIYKDNGADQDTALENLAEWKKKLEAAASKPQPPRPPTP